MALVEALAAGLPCVAARVGGIPDILVHGRNGLLFERENVGALAEQLVHLAADTNLRRQLAEAAPGSVQGFGLEPHADNMMAIYTEALQEACVT
jgi:glycosyltransferase involved in cell wall biosynthesis